MKALKIFRPPSEELPDIQVIQRVLNGEKEWFEVLVRRHNQTLYRAIRSYLKQESEVEDAMQETYLKVYQKLDQFRGDASFTTWMVRIGINEALQRIRKKKREKLSVETPVEQVNTFPLMPQHNMNPEKKIIQAEARIMLEAAIDELPPKYRAVYMLREVEGMKNPAIAASLDLSEANVKVRYHRALKLLKAQLLHMATTTELYEFGNSRCDRMVEWVMARV